MYTTKRNNRFRILVVGVSLGTALLTAGTGFIDNSSTAYAATATAKSTVSTTSNTSLAEQIIATGMKYKGVKYEYGAEAGNTSSFDCSSFTQYIFGQHDISLSRSSKQQSTDGTYIARNQLQPGDLVFFYSPIHHVAVYIGDGKILHTYGEGGVTVTDLDSGWWDEHYTTARRVLPSDSQDISKADAGSKTDTNSGSAAGSEKNTSGTDKPQTETETAPQTAPATDTAADTASDSSGSSSQDQASGFGWGWFSNFR